MADTGAGATLTLATTTNSLTVRSMTLPEQTIDTLDISALDTSNYMEMIPTDLADPGELSVEILYDGTEAAPSLGVAETVTVTFPKVDSTNTNDGATLAGTGFIKGFKFPDLQVGELQIATMTIQFDGGANSGTEPTWTAGV